MFICSFCSNGNFFLVSGYILPKTPLIQLQHEQKIRLGNNSHDSIKAALEASNGRLFKDSQRIHEYHQQPLTPTNTQREHVTQCQS
jgi:hypothetical protein